MWFERPPRWDGACLQQVVRNLVSNALQYGREGAPVVVTLTGEKSAVHFAVTNHGPTIEHASWEEIFDPLRRCAVPDQEKGRATHMGLGLFVVREVIKAHGGTVEVHSADEGTVFAVRLPR